MAENPFRLGKMQQTLFDEADARGDDMMKEVLRERVGRYSLIDAGSYGSRGIDSEEETQPIVIAPRPGMDFKPAMVGAAALSWRTRLPVEVQLNDTTTRIDMSTPPQLPAGAEIMPGIPRQRLDSFLDECDLTTNVLTPSDDLTAAQILRAGTHAVRSYREQLGQ